MTHNGAYAVPGFAGSLLANLEVTLDNHAALLKKIKEEYTGRMVDILDVSSGM